VSPRKRRKLVPFRTARTLAYMRAAKRVKVLQDEIDALEAWIAEYKEREEAPREAKAPARRLRLVASASVCRTKPAD